MTILSALGLLAGGFLFAPKGFQFAADIQDGTPIKMGQALFKMP